MPAIRKDLEEVANAVGYKIPEQDVDDFTVLLERARQTFEVVSAMDGILAQRLS